jgi:predicted RNase H-like HicB family nuclease
MSEYCQKAIERAEYKKLADGSWFAEIPGFQGVWANGDSVEQCRNELVTVLEEWLLLKVTGKKTRELFNIVKDVPQILTVLACPLRFHK